MDLLQNLVFSQVHFETVFIGLVLNLVFHWIDQNQSKHEKF